MRTARFAVYAIFLIALLTVAVHVRLWFEGIDANPYATIYRTRTKTVYVEVPRDKKEEKGLKRVTVPCRPVQVLLAQDEPNTPDNRQPSHDGAIPPGSSVTNLEPHSSDTSRMLEPALLGVFRVPPLPEGGSARVTLDEAGAAHLEVKPKPLGLFALGRLRELSLWGGVRLDDSSRYSWAISYQQDIVRVGPTWLRGRVEYGDDGFGSRGKAELGIAIRF